MHMLRSKKGFTIVELAVVIVVIGILVTISVVSYKSYINDSAEAAAEADLQQISVKYESYRAANGVYPTMQPSDLPKTRDDREYTLGLQFSGLYCVSTTVPQTGKTMRMVGWREGAFYPITGNTGLGLKEGECPRLNPGVPY